MSTEGFSSQPMHAVQITYKISAAILKQPSFLYYDIVLRKQFQSFSIAHARLRT
jgi:hypothetical protein